MYNIKKMMLSLKIGAIVLIAMYSFLVLAIQPALAQKFWSPKEIVLDTYTRPIPFRCGNDTCPFVTYDHKYLFFIRNDNRGALRIFWVDAKIINELKPEQ